MSQKNRQRDDYTFANINLLGKCNIDCFFCLGKDIKDELKGKNQLDVHFSEWVSFFPFLSLCRMRGIRKIYITGQNTDSLLYKHLEELIHYLHHGNEEGSGFQVGLRTNGYLALDKMDVINMCDLSTGYSIHTLNSVTSKMILGREDIPCWNNIILATERPRISIVLNRCNEYEFFDILQFLRTYDNIRYVQVRKPSTDTREKFLAPDMAAYERVYTQVSRIFPLQRKFATDAEVYSIYGMDVVFWRTVSTSVNSMNYFTDGTISDMYFVVEGYLKAQNISV